MHTLSLTSTVALLALALGACDRQPREVPSGAPTPEPTAAPGPSAERTPAAAAGPFSDVPFRWYRRFPEAGVPSPRGIGIVPEVRVPVAGDRRTYTARTQNGQLFAERRDATGRDVWSVALTRDAVGEAVVMAPPDREAVLYVATRVEAGGTSVLALSRADGDLLWRAQRPDPSAQGAGRVQLGEHDGRLVLHVRRARGAHLDVLQPDTGALLGRRRFGPEILERDLETSDPGRPGASLNAGRFPAAGGGHYEGGRIQTRTGQSGVRLRRVGPDGRELWSTLMDVDGSVVDSLCAVEAADQVIAVLYGSRTPGVALRSFGRARGTLRWARPLEPWEGVAHATYGRRVSLRVDGRLVVVRGVGPAEGYLATFVVRDGTPLSLELWR